MTYKKKLIEVALPLEAINKASAREKSIRHGHPSTLHLWWARRPLAVARAVIFAQMVDDPSEYLDVLMSDPAKKRAGQAELRKRHELWEKRKTEHERAQAAGDTSVAAPGEAPTLEECVADLERQRLFAIIEQLVQWENTTNERCCRRRATRSGRAGDAHAPRMPAIPGRRSFSTGTSCRPSTTRSPAAGRCHSRRSGWGWRRMRRTSIPWRC
jgi:Protein of unknown function (DUF1156)